MQKCNPEQIEQQILIDISLSRKPSGKGGSQIRVPKRFVPYIIKYKLSVK